MRAGLLNRRIVLQSRTETQGSTGEVSWTWTDVDEVWAAIEPLSTRSAYRENIVAEQMQQWADVRIRIRYRHGITPKHRVKYDEPGSPTYTRYYDIEAVVSPREGRKELHLLCKERGSDGFRD